MAVTPLVNAGLLDSDLVNPILLMLNSGGLNIHRDDIPKVLEFYSPELTAGAARVTLRWDLSNRELGLGLGSLSFYEFPPNAKTGLMLSHFFGPEVSFPGFRYTRLGGKVGLSCFVKF